MVQGGEFFAEGTKMETLSIGQGARRARASVETVRFYECKWSLEEPPRRIGGTRLSVTGILACPCHLILTLPRLFSGLSGTALGSFLSTGLVYAAIGGQPSASELVHLLARDPRRNARPPGS
jgi:hypothetical protein